MKFTNLPSIVAAFLVLTAFSNCDGDDPFIENPEELITTVRLEFTPQAGGQTRLFEFRDLDGDGGNPPVVTSDILKANTSYMLELKLLNEASNPVIDVGAEIREEATNHQFFFTVDGVAMEITYEDEDPTGNPIGLENKATAHEAGTGTLTVILRHNPDKFGAAVSAGIIDNAGGSTDLEVVFDLRVQ